MRSRCGQTPSSGRRSAGFSLALVTAAGALLGCANDAEVAGAPATGGPGTLDGGATTSDAAAPMQAQDDGKPWYMRDVDASAPVQITLDELREDGGPVARRMIKGFYLSLDRMFERDLEDGALDLLAMGPLPLEVVSVVKCLAQWLVGGAPLALAAPVAAIALGGPPQAAPMIVLVAAMGGMAFAFLGGAGAALALASRRGGVLVAVIVLPLLSPPVIFGGAAIESAARASGGLAAGGLAAILLLGAYTLATVALAPFVMAGACRNALS